MQALIDFLGTQGFMPHGYCLSWTPSLLWLHVVSDAAVVLAYYSIPLTLAYFVKKRRDLPYPWLFAMFGLFIVACGTTHLLSIVMIWQPWYWLDGLVKAFTAIISVATAYMAYRIVPQALTLRSPAQLQIEVERQSRSLVNTIEQLQKTQAALQTSEQRLKLAAASGQVGIWDYNILTRELIWDDTMFALYGANRQAFSGAYDAWSSRLHPDDIAVTEVALQDAIAGIRDYEPEFRVVWPNGEIRHIKGHAVVIRDETGAPVRMIGTNWDNHEHADTRRRLQLAHTAINTSRCAYFWVNRLGEVAELNEYARNSLGYSREEISGLKVWDFDPNLSAAGWDEHWKENKAKGVRTFESLHRRKDGTIFPVELTTNYLAVGEEEYSFSFCLDISQRKQAERALKQSQAKLIRQEKLAAMGTLIGGIAHEVNNPLMGISGYINYAYESMADGKPRQMLTKAQKEVDRIARIVSSMLVFGRHSLPEKQEAAVDSALDIVVSLVEAEYKEAEIELHVGVQAGLPPAAINIDGLQQILLNLLLNARDSIKHHELPREVCITVAMREDTIEIAVRDNGPGVAAAMVAQIFDPFFTTKAPGEGTGLGLAVSRQMAEEVGGSLEYHGSLGGGCFILRLLPHQTDIEGLNHG
ncbi:MAG: PAS domain-containing protein [Methylomonas sp.]|nr:PAS domain-containing protein [Methylomonas sp.]